MRLLRALVIVALLAVVVYVGYRYFVARQGGAPAGTIAVYYTKTDGQTVVPWRVTLGAARDPKSVAFYAATQALVGPPADVEAIRFPPGTIARSVDVTDQTATVDLNDAVTKTQGGSFAEAGEFKALVWTLTALPHVASVQIKVGGARLANLPGGHLELDEPLTRSSF